MTSIYNILYKIDNTIPGIHLEKIEGASVVGEPLSNAEFHPIQWRAYTNVLPGMDDPFEGVAWTADKAFRELLKNIKAHV